MDDEAGTPAPPPEPLFSLELAENGGTFAPVDAAGLIAWIEQERAFWSWIVRRGHGAPVQFFGTADERLAQALNLAQEAARMEHSSPEPFMQRIERCRSHIQAVFLESRFPHSSTPHAKRIEQYRLKRGDTAASFFATALYPPPDSNQQFNPPNNYPAWMGWLKGLADQGDIPLALAESRREAAETAFEQLRAKAETLVGEKTAVLGQLHRDYASIADHIRSSATESADAFNQAQDKRSEEFSELVAAHKAEMEQLRKTFREEIALRAPAEYWNSKRNGHFWWTIIWGGISFVAIGCATWWLGTQIHDLLGNVEPGGAPEYWRVAMLLLVGVFGVWAIRLVVRIFLSHMHLSADSAERVVMLRTYLSLLEGDRLSSKEDRQLILQALFRPASDGIVKDEGLPPSWFEFLSRQPKG